MSGFLSIGGSDINDDEIERQERIGKEVLASLLALLEFEGSVNPFGSFHILVCIEAVQSSEGIS